MTSGMELPMWTAFVTAGLMLAGALLAFIGSLGLVRMKTFYERVHPPTLATTLGTALILIGSMVFFTVVGSRAVLHEILIAVFMAITTPVTYMMLVRAALFRDESEGSSPVGRSDKDRRPENAAVNPAEPPVRR